VVDSAPFGHLTHTPACSPPRPITWTVRSGTDDEDETLFRHINTDTRVCISVNHCDSLVRRCSALSGNRMIP
jgi:hypothetical protein